MTHIEWIESSKTWTCPKSGKYKVICVGGGASGGGKLTTSGYTSTVAGGTTSFGSILSAAGGKSDGAGASVENASRISGYGGFTGFSCGGLPSLIYEDDTKSLVLGTGNAGMPGAEVSNGYGAGGGASSGTNKSSIPGRAGSIKTTIVDIEAGEAIACTIGAGGVSSAGTGSAASGAKGVIVVQYLGA